MKRLLFVLVLLGADKLHAQPSFGFTYSYDFDGVMVDVVFKNGPAEKAGIRHGDIILMVNDTVLRTIPKERIANVFATAPLTSKFQLGYIGEDEEVYRGEKVIITKEERNNFLNKCLEGNCTNGTGKHLDLQGAVYEGQFKNGKRNGKGKCTEANGVVYEGEWKENKREGYGKAFYKVKGYDFANKSWSYEGTWKNDVMNGKGTYVAGDGSYYTGDMKDNKFEGNGRMLLKDSTVYEGEWKDNALNGKGSVTTKNGDVKTGTFVNSKLDGMVLVFTKATNTTTMQVYVNGKPQ